MSGECVFDLVGPEPEATRREGKQHVGRTRMPRKAAPPPTASTFGIHGTSAVVANAGGEYTEPSVHPAKKPIGTFGRSVGPTVNPSEFLKKNEGPFTASRGAPTVNHSSFKKSDYHREKVKPDIPNRYDKPVMGLKTDKNFVVANAVENTLAIPAASVPAAQPRATDRSDFGQVPVYLQEINAEIRERREAVASYSASVRAAHERWSELSEGELNELRSGLQRRWDIHNKEYQSRGFSKLQTPSQKSYQEQLEKELRALEFAMQKLSRAHVFVYDDQR